jgi:hypothetical protein
MEIQLLQAYTPNVQLWLGNDGADFRREVFSSSLSFSFSVSVAGSSGR